MMRHRHTRTLGCLIRGWLVAGVLTLVTAACSRDEPPAATESRPAGQEGRQPSDAQITTNVQARYYSDGLVRGENISVMAVDGTLTLRGNVESETVKQRAVALARNVEGVRQVNDELRVDNKADTTIAGRTSAPSAVTPTGTAGRADDPSNPVWITTKIQARYFLDPDLKPWNIDVTTAANGAVTLAGEVDSAENRANAVRIAQTTEGVSKVDDQLRVKGEAGSGDTSATGAASAGVQGPDLWLTAKVQAKYFVDDLVKMRNIDVDTQNGEVTLSGTVGSEAERRRALALARNTEGVREVTDQLKIDAKLDAEAGTAGRQRDLPTVPPLKRPDPWITMKVQSQFFLDPEIKAHKIDVNTNAGVVTLKGTVATAAQKKEAEQIARDTEGVTRVVNQLTVTSG